MEISYSEQSRLFWAVWPHVTTWLARNRRLCFAEVQFDRVSLYIVGMAFDAWNTYTQVEQEDPGWYDFEARSTEGPGWPWWMARIRLKVLRSEHCLTETVAMVLQST